MWTKPWKYKEGTAVCLGLGLVGTMLQYSIGPINWDLFAAPVNVLFLAIYVAVLVAAYILRGKLYAVRWAMTYHAAIPAIAIAGLATLVYGITCDRNTLSAWPFVIIYFWLTAILGLTSLQHLHKLFGRNGWNGKTVMREIPFLLNHLGLFIAIVCATLGSADMQKLKMTVQKEQPEWRAVEETSEMEGKVVELDVAIQLNHFAIEEYPPKLVVISNETGKVLPMSKPESFVVEDSVASGELLGHKIRVEKMYQYCAQFIGTDTVNYVPWSYSGATTAALVSIDGKPAQWVSNGSYMFPYRPLRIDKETSLVMPECEPKRFTSNVNVYTEKGQQLKDVEIEVNKPLEVEGWKIYQLSYDETKGRWSDVSVLELVRDPWLPWVYIGIYMLLAGAVWMFVYSPRKS